MAAPPSDFTEARTLSALVGLPLFGPAAGLDVDGGASGDREAARGAPAALAAAVGLSTVHIRPFPETEWNSYLIDNKKCPSLYWILRPMVNRIYYYCPPPPIHYRAGQVEVALGGGLVKLRGRELPGDTMRAVVGRAPRGRVKGLSRGSRRRLLEKFASVDRRREMYRQLLITLTYPAVWPADPVEWKRHQAVFQKRFRRKFPTASIIWVMEAQERGAPHWHMIVYNVGYVAYEWVGQMWADITGGNAKACSEVRRIRSYRGVMSYAAKYAGKGSEDRFYRAGPDGEILEFVGRPWGIVNKAGLPADIRKWALSVAEFYNLRRLLYRYLRSQMRARGSKRRPAPRDMSAGVSVFLPWFSGVQLAAFVGADINVTRLALQSSRIEQETEDMRRLLAEVRRRAGPGPVVGGKS